MKAILVVIFCALTALAAQAQTFFKDTNGKWGVKDAKGKVIVAGKYLAAGKFENGLAVVENETPVGELCGVIDATGKEIVPVRYGKIELGKFGSSKHGMLIKALDFNFVFWTLIDPKTGEDITTRGRYYKIEPFVQGSARVDGANGTSGFIDETGKEISSLKSVADMAEGLMAATDNFEKALATLDEINVPVTKPAEKAVAVSSSAESKFIYKADYTEGLAKVVVRGTRKTGFVDEKDNEVIKAIYDGALPFSYGLAAVEIGGKWGYINKTGKLVIPIKYGSTVVYLNNAIGVELNGKYGFIDRNGNEITPIKYQTNRYFTEGMAPVKFNDKWGYINESGKEVIPFLYDKTDNFKNGRAKVEKNGRSFFIDKSGKEIQ